MHWYQSVLLASDQDVPLSKATCAQDYLIAQGVGKLMPGQLPRTALKYSFSQDGVKWVDLEALSDEVATKAADIIGMLSGEPAKAYNVQAPGAVPLAEEEVAAQTQTCVTVDL